MPILLRWKKLIGNEIMHFFLFFFLEKGALELQLDELKTSLDSMKRKTIYHISIELFIS